MEQFSQINPFIETTNLVVFIFAKIGYRFTKIEFLPYLLKVVIQHTFFSKALIQVSSVLVLAVT